jgi:cytochrome P450 family 6
MLGTLDSLLLQLAAATCIILAAIIVYFKISYSYWKKRGVPTLKPTVPFGNFRDSVLFGRNPGFEITHLYKAFEHHRIGGVYNLSGPSLLIRDTEIIKDVLIKDFDHFFSRGRSFDEEYEPLDAHLFSLSGTKWRNLRVNLTPVFTSRKMKMMFGTVVECGKELENYLQKPASNGETIELKDILARYSTDIIASCAFGVQCNCLRNPDAEFRSWGRRVFETKFRQRLTTLLNIVYPSLVYTLKLSLIPKDVSNYFRKMVTETLEYRENNNVERNDFMQLMIQLKNKTLDTAEEEDMTLLEKESDRLERSNKPFGK